MFPMTPMDDAEVIAYRRRQAAKQKNGNCWADAPSPLSQLLRECPGPNETRVGLCEEHYEAITGRPFSEGREPIPLPVYKDGCLVD